MLGNTIERDLVLRAPLFPGCFGHAVDDGTGFVLRESKRAVLPEFQETLRAVLTHSREDSCDPVVTTALHG